MNTGGNNVAANKSTKINLSAERDICRERRGRGEQEEVSKCE